MATAVPFALSLQFRVERQWMVKLCADSLSDTSEYLLLEKSRVYKYCLLLYADPGVDTTTQVRGCLLSCNLNAQLFYRV